MDEVTTNSIALEPFTYTEDFEKRTQGAWASYPLWQDTAYDPNFRVGELVPGDPNISLVQKVTPYSPVDNYAGAQKLLDMYMTPESTITLRYYLKSHLPFEFFKVRIAAGVDGAIDCTIANPPLNRWEWVTVTYDDFTRENPKLAGKKVVKVNALAVLANMPAADPAMPFYLGLDDITFRGARAVVFRFEEPETYKLPEWKPYIPKRHYHRGDIFSLRGNWPVDADRAEAVFTPFIDSATVLRTEKLEKDGDRWTMKPLPLDWPDGLYRGLLRAFREDDIIADTEFTLHIAPANMSGKHPRLWFNEAQKQEIIARLGSDRFSDLFDRLPREAARYREEVPPESLVFDLDQFPDEDWLPTWNAWGSRLYSTAEPLYLNSLVYALYGDRTAGTYVRDVLLALAKFENWTHPWQTKRGRFTEHRSGWWAHRLALAYDLTFDLMDESERASIRRALMNNIVETTHRMYVVDNDVTSNTSNWISHVAGASLMVQAAVFGDGPDTEEIEPYFTGAALKLYTFIMKVVDPDGAWCEGLGYNNYTFHTLCQSLPAVEHVFNIDMSQPLEGTYREYIWAGPVRERNYFYFGDTEGYLNPITNWAWLLAKYRDPLLGWLYNFLKGGTLESNTKASMTGYMNLINKKDETFMDVLYETGDVSRRDPFGENPVRCFRNVGTTVFKSGWESGDFIFVMRTGPFCNHQHIDQGTFWLADRGTVFIGERSGSSYYDDPLYQPWYTQPAAHSTILINGNHQSQRVGDPRGFAGGFEDYAFIRHFLDGASAAFVSGDIGRLYWGKVREMQRNVLYLKSRTLLMLDTVIPVEQDADVTLLYQTRRLEEIHPGETMSAIAKDGSVLHIGHMHPEHVHVAAVETPHYLYTLREEKPLKKEGMLTVTARTEGAPLIMANILTTTAEGASPDFTIHKGDGCCTGAAGEKPFLFSTRPGRRYTGGGFSTDALALTWSGGVVFAALCTLLERDGRLLVESEEPITCEVSPEGMTYCLAHGCTVFLGVDAKPWMVTVNGEQVKPLYYDSSRGAVRLTLPPGEGRVSVVR
ncbi:heparinase II/III family protein [bacterium]|nr:heparinase II/III family protein [bacterium]